ncbi:MAG: hypothetical protein EA397_14320 [Deltaproteobacteria bacterium]|nr:MAG: hypothetical protein EA397_14320 [Deltaproteobacteria bacterium]
MATAQPPISVSSPEELVARRQRAKEQRKSALATVQRLADSQANIGQELRSELEALQRQGHELEELEATQPGLIDGLLRRITGRRLVLERRSATDALVRRYEAVSTRLRTAAAFADELRLASLQLHEEVQSLHKERAAANQSVESAARRVLEIEQQIRAHEAGEPCAATLDDLQFEHRYQSQAMQVGRAAAKLIAAEIPVAQQLRGTVQDLHEEMQHFVLSATTIVDGAGRRIQALGAAADAPIVVGELQQSLTELGEAMRATEIYLEHVGELVAHKLPDLSARLQAEAESNNAGTQADLEHLDRVKARAEAERALREAAAREVEELSRGRR